MDLDDMARRFADYRKYYPTDTEFRKEITQAVGEAYYKAGKTEEAIAVYRNYLQEHYDLEITQALTVALLKENVMEKWKNIFPKCRKERKINIFEELLLWEAEIMHRRRYILSNLI